MNQKGFSPIIILVFVVITMALAGVAYVRFFKVKQSVPTSTPIIDENVQNTTIDSPIAVYQEGSMIYSINTKGEKNKYLTKEALQGVSPDGEYFFTYSQINNTSYLRSAIGKVLQQFEGQIDPQSWLLSNQSVLVYQMPSLSNPLFRSQNYKLLDLNKKQFVKTLDEDFSTIPEILYNGDILVQKNLAQPSEQQNVELRIYKGSNSTSESIGKFKVGSASSMSVISNDHKKLAISSNNNLYIYDFEKGSYKQITEYHLDKISLGMESMHWSPDDKFIAFQTEGSDVLTERIGIINLNTKQIDYIDENTAERILKKSGSVVSYFAPIHWKDNNNLYIKFEGSPLDGKRADEYLEYNLVTKELKVMPAFSGIQSVYFLK